MRTALCLAIALNAVGCPAPANAPDVPPEPAPHTFAPSRLDPAPLAGETIIARWNGGALTAQDLHARTYQELRNREIRYLLDRFDLTSRTLDAMVIEALLQTEADRRGLASVEALLRIEVDGKVADPTQGEIERLYPQMAPQLHGASLEESRPILIAELVRRAAAQRHRHFIEELRGGADLRIELPYPDLPRVDAPVESHDPTLGPHDARVTIIQFAEYQCFYCGRVHDSLRRLVDRYPDDVRIVWKDFPLSNHTRAKPAAIAAHCAGDQGMYWEMSERLLTNQHALSEADIAGYAREIGISTEPFQRCLSEGRHEDGIRADLDLGRRLGVQATPTFFINGILVSGAQPFERFQGIVARELGE